MCKKKEQNISLKSNSKLCRKFEIHSNLTNDTPKNDTNDSPETLSFASNDNIFSLKITQKNQ